jgi:hypothetical protein
MSNKTPKAASGNIRRDSDEIIIRTKNTVKNKFLRVPGSPVTLAIQGGDIPGGEAAHDQIPYKTVRSVRVGYTEKKEESSVASDEQKEIKGGREQIHMETRLGKGSQESTHLRVPTVTGGAALRTGGNETISGLKPWGNRTVSASLRSKDPRFQTSSDSFSQEFVYAATVLVVLVVLMLVWRVSKTVYATLNPAEEERLEVAVTRDMRYSKYEIVSPDTYNGDAVRKDGTRRRNRSASSASSRSSSATNTFLLFSPTTGE